MFFSFVLATREGLVSNGSKRVSMGDLESRQFHYSSDRSELVVRPVRIEPLLNPAGGCRLRLLDRTSLHSILSSFRYLFSTNKAILIYQAG